MKTIDSVKNGSKDQFKKESKKNEHSTAGIVEKVYEESELYQHGRDYGSHEGDVLRCHPDRYGGGVGRGAGPGTVSAGGGS